MRGWGGGIHVRGWGGGRQGPLKDGEEGGKDL